MDMLFYFHGRAGGGTGALLHLPFYLPVYFTRWPLEFNTCHCKKVGARGRAEARGLFNNNVSSVPCGDGRRVNEGGQLKRICRHVPQSILGGEFLTQF